MCHPRPVCAALLMVVLFAAAPLRAGEVPAVSPVASVSAAGQADFEAGKKFAGKRQFAEAAALLEKAAAVGHLGAMRALGDACLKGEGVPKNQVAAKAWFDKIEARANAGDAEAAFEAGNRLCPIYHGPLVAGFPKDTPAALGWYSKAAQGGSVRGMRALGFMHMEGRGARKDAAAAETWLTKAGEAGDGHAWYLLAFLKSSGVWGAGRIDADKGLPLLGKSASLGYPLAMKRLGELHCDPKFNPELWDLKQAQDWLLRSAEAGASDAANVLFMNFINEFDTAIQAHLEMSNESMRWFSEDGAEITKAQFVDRVEGVAIKSGNTFMIWQLAQLHASGSVIPLDIPRAIHCYEKAAEAGEGSAQRIMARLCEAGEMVPLDYAKAMSWYQAAIAGMPPGASQADIGRMYAHGQGVPQDDAKALAWYELAAKGSSEGVYELASCYYYGRGVKQDIPKAKAMYEKIAPKTKDTLRGGESNQAGSQLARMWRRGYGVPVDHAKALACFERGSHFIGDGAYALLGEVYSKGQGVPKNARLAAQEFRRALVWGVGGDRHNVAVMVLQGKDADCEAALAPDEFLWAVHEGAGYSERSLGLVFDDRGRPPAEEERNRQAFLAKIKGGDLQALTSLGRAYLHGDSGFYMDPSEAIVWMRQAAERGDPEAMDLLGSLKARGVGMVRTVGSNISRTKKDEVAFPWFQKSADAGHPRAMFNLGFAYDRGLGVPADLEKAVAWYAKGAAAGDTFAMIAIAELARSGAVGDADPAKALRWYTAAADKGNLLAMRVLADAYRTGGWTGADGKWAFAWYEKAAAKGDPEAMFRLGLALRNGTTVAVDDAKATAWYEKAAQLGHSGAMRNLGAAYRDGKGVKEDAKTAWVWFELAARDLSKNAAEYRDAVGGQWTEEQLKEAKAAADALGTKIWPDR